jgi:hypothetical protein
MFLLLMAVTSGLMSSPELLNGSQTITPDDYPQQMLRSDQSAFEDIRIVVAPSGKPETCDVIGEVRGGHDVGTNKEAGQISCDLMIRRGKFEPATGPDGLPSYGTYSAWISWRTGAGLSYRQPDQVDGDISVASLPKGMPDPALVDVDVAVAADGTPGACSPAPKAKHASALQVISPALAAVACSQFVGSGRLSPARSKSGVMVNSVQRLVARFSTAKVDPAITPGQK